MQLSLPFSSDVVCCADLMKATVYTVKTTSARVSDFLSLAKLTEILPNL